MNSGDNYIGEHATSKVQDVSKEERGVILQHTSRFETCLQWLRFTDLRDDLKAMEKDQHA